MPARRSGARARVPGLVWAASAVHVGLLLVFTLLYPPFAGFDETQHVDAVLSLRSGDGWPAPQERELSQGIVAVAQPVIASFGDLPFSDDPLPPRDERPSIASLGADRASTGQVLPNQITQHPPLYYALGAALLAVLPGSSDWPYDRTVAVLRLLSVVLMAPLPLLAWATARALGTSPAVGTCAAALVLTVPQLQRVGAAVNNDALYVPAFAATAVLLARIARGDLRRRTALLTGAVLGLALLTKGFALVLPPAVALAYGASALRSGGLRRARPWGLAALAQVVGFCTGGWWWLRNLLVHGTLQPSGWPADWPTVIGMVPRSPDTPAPVLPFVTGAYARLTERFWGGLEINYAGPDTFPRRLLDLLVLIGVVVLAVALVRGRGARLPLAVAVAAPFLAVLALVTFGMWRGYVEYLDYVGAQGRYLFGSVPGLAAGAALGLALLGERLRRLLLPLVVLAAAVLQGRAVGTVLARTWLPPYDPDAATGVWEQALTGILDRSPWPPGVTLAVPALLAVAGAVLGVLAVRQALGRAPQPYPG